MRRTITRTVTIVTVTRSEIHWEAGPAEPAGANPDETLPALPAPQEPPTAEPASPPPADPPTPA